MTSSWKHSIGYRDLYGSYPKSPVKIPATVNFYDGDYVYELEFGRNQWDLQVGRVLNQLLLDAAPPIPDQTPWRLELFGLEVVRFSKGLFLWSRHIIDIRFEYELFQGDRFVTDGIIEETGRGSGLEFGLRVFIPVLGTEQFDMGVELALSRTLKNGLSTLARTLKGAS